jgi:hypothetical protein
VAFGIFVWLVVASGLILGTSGMSLAVPTESISNLLLEEEQLVFGIRQNGLYLYTYMKMKKLENILLEHRT